MLDTSKVEKNAKGTMAAARTPVVYVRPELGMRKELRANYQTIVTVPGDNDASVKIIWLRNGETGQLAASKVFDEETRRVDGDGPATLVGLLTQPYAGVKEGTSIVPSVYFSDGSLWEGKPFTLCSEGCANSGVLGPQDFGLDTRIRRPRGDLGAELLRKARAR